ncbi:unnamed protein product [Heligmosomoides polygyrus]|uniref:Retrotrans_gag domain-containing protein n=1 Tax=Heligmosomoides polygyrus TaxID=6339 RepID=A0A183GE82_HELPZ|nr:unnamed protein product [Heligmosomoides polygyrus]
MTWEQLVTTLATKLKNQAALSNIRDELHNISLTKDSVGEFATKVLTMTKFAFQGLDDRVVSQMAIDFFIIGLNPELRKKNPTATRNRGLRNSGQPREKEHRIFQQERKEDSESIQVLNAVLLDERLNSLQQQFDDMQYQLSTF